MCAEHTLVIHSAFSIIYTLMYDSKKRRGREAGSIARDREKERKRMKERE